MHERRRTLTVGRPRSKSDATERRDLSGMLAAVNFNRAERGRTKQRDQQPEVERDSDAWWRDRDEELRRQELERRYEQDRSWLERMWGRSPDGIRTPEDDLRDGDWAPDQRDDDWT